MWVVFAFASAVFAGLTAILAKCGIRNTDSNMATALRTAVVLVFSWVMVFVTGVSTDLSAVSGRTLVFLILSGLATGASWLCYFKALQIGDVNKVTPVDKASTVLTMLLAWVLLGEPVSLLKAAAMVSIGLGTWLMIQKKNTAGQDMPEDGASVGGRKDSHKTERAGHSAWLWYAAGSAVFASLTSILGKIGIEGIDSTLGTAIRTIVVLIMAWIVVFVTGKQHTVREIDAGSWIFLILSGFATGGSWLCYYRALQDGPASVVVPIDKLSILPTVLFSGVVLKERLGRKAAAGLLLVTAGTLALLI